MTTESQQERPYRAQWDMHNATRTSGLIWAPSASEVEERIRRSGGTPTSVVLAE